MEISLWTPGLIECKERIDLRHDRKGPRDFSFIEGRLFENRLTSPTNIALHIDQLVIRSDNSFLARLHHGFVAVVSWICLHRDCRCLSSRLCGVVFRRLTAL